MADVVKTDLLESTVKVFTLFAVVLTSAGFLIVSLHDREYGFFPTNPLRPRMLAAGFLFLLFAIVPGATGYITLHAACRYWLVAGSSQKKQLIAIATPLFVTLVSAMCFFARPLIGVSHIPFWDGTLPGVASTIAAPLTLVSIAASAGTSRSARFVGSASAVLAIALLIKEVLVVIPYVDHLMVTVWIVFISLAALLVTFFTRLSTGSFWPDLRLALPKYGVQLLSLPGVLLAAFLFSAGPYAHIGANWGGGKPVRATIVLSKDSPNPGASIQVRLVDETDLGVYVSEAEEGPAKFIPRASISEVDYKPEVVYSVPMGWNRAEEVESIFK